MTVIIRDLDKPAECVGCKFCLKDHGRDYCIFDGEYINWEDGTINPDCPLEEYAKPIWIQSGPFNVETSKWVWRQNMSDLMGKEDALKVLDMFLFKQCDLERTSFAYDQSTVWGAVKMATDALAGIGKQAAEPRWIPVSDKLPKVGQSVLGCDMDGGIFVDWLNENHEWAICEQTWAQMVAWMPLPEPYQEADHD